MRKLILIVAALSVLICGPALAAGPWIASAVVAQSGTVSAAVTLPGSNIFGSPIRTLTLYIPTIDSATVGLQVSGDGGTTYADLRSLNNGTNMVYTSTAAGTGGYFMSFPGVDFGNFTHVKVKCGAAQTSAARTFILYGSP